MNNHLLLVFTSWEQRSVLGSIRELETSGISSVLSLGYEFPFNKEDIDKNVNIISEYCREHKINIINEELSRDPRKCWFKLKEVIANLSHDIIQEITMDISTMPRNIIWQILYFMRQYEFNHINIVYHQPQTYTNEWISRDPCVPRLLMKHSGIMEIDRKTALIIITSFDCERTRQIVSSFEPEKVVLLVQQGSQLNNNIRNIGEEHRKICQSNGINDITIAKIDSFDDNFGFSSICDAIEICWNYNIVLTSFGPKTSAIGAYKAVLAHPEIALCYVPCNEYNISYCRGIGDSFKLSLVFNAISKEQ